MSHTPGPWVRFVDAGDTMAIMAAGRPGDVAAFKEPVKEADALLMTAAPDLFEACKAAAIILAMTVGGAAYRGSAIDLKLSAAMAKAKGEFWGEP